MQIEKTNDCGWFVCRWDPVDADASIERSWDNYQVRLWILHTIHAKCATMDHAYGWCRRHGDVIRRSRGFPARSVLWVCRTPFWSKRFFLDWREPGELI